MIKKICAGLSLLFLQIDLYALEKIKTGPWRLELSTVHTVIPFIIELEMKGDKLEGRLFNGKETIPLDNITYQGKSLNIPLQNYENSLELKLESPDRLKGHFVRHNKVPKVEFPVTGVHGQRERFPGKKSPPKVDLSGKWSVSVKEPDIDLESDAIIVFEQKGANLTGTILTATGDQRYFEGHISGHGFQVASFDGVYNYILKGRIKDKTLKATQHWPSYVSDMKGKRDPKAELPDAYKQTTIGKMDFTFPDLEDKKVSLSDAKFKGKPVIVQFFGSWCPNCVDEMNYLIPWYKENSPRGIEIVTLAFERSLSPKEARAQLLKVQKKMDVPYTILQAGSSAQDKPMDKISGLKNFISFPTTVFLNKNHEVVKVHAGFTGPSTGEYFEKWKNEFNQTVDELLK